MNITLNQIRDHYLCKSSWEVLLKSLDKTKADDEPLSLIYILDVLGINDAIWYLKCLEYKDYCLFLADAAESVLHIFEKRFPGDDRPRKCIEGVRNYHKGLITKEELAQLRTAVYACDAYAYAYVSEAAVYATDSAAVNAASVAHAVVASAAVNAGYGAVYGAVNAAAREKKLDEIEVLFRKHFGEEDEAIIRE